MGGVFDSIYSCNGDKFFNAYCLIVKIPRFFILKNLGIFMYPPGFSIALHRGFSIALHRGF